VADPPEREGTRLEALSDGVFAFAITLLVLDIKLPDSASLRSATGAWQALRANAPELLALLLTFASVFILWVSHHGILRRVRHVDGSVLYANGLLLLFISTCAFPTAFLADGIGEPAGHLAAFVYATYFLCTYLSFNLLLAAIQRRHHRTLHGYSDLEVHATRRRLLVGAVTCVGAAALAWVSPWLTVLACGSLWTFFVWRGVGAHSHSHEMTG